MTAAATDTDTTGYRQTPVTTDEFLKQLLTDCRDSPSKIAGTNITMFNAANEKTAIMRIAVALIEEEEAA